jgi:hypothetical protein
MTRERERQEREQQQAANAAAAKKRAEVAEMARMAAQGVKDWGGDSGDEDEAGAKKAKQLSEEELLAKTQAMLKTYMLLENKKEALSSAQAVKRAAPEAFMAQLVRRCVAQVFDDAGVKECKLVAALLAGMLKDGTVTKQQLGEGIERAAVLAQAHKDKKQSLTSLAKLLKEGGSLEGVALGEVTAQVTGLGADGADHAGASAQEQQAVLAAALVAGDKRGKDLAAQVAEHKLVPAFAAALVRAVFAKDAQLAKTDEAVQWLDKKTGFGAMLAKLLYAEDPNKEQKVAQLAALKEVQAAYHAVQFPRAANKQALLEKAFMRLYNEDIVPHEAVTAWKDDLSDTPGKTEALMQLSQFISWLDADSEEDE